MKNEKKIIKLTPDTKTKTNHVNNISNVWPRSGCKIKNKTIGNNKNKLIKYTDIYKIIKKVCSLNLNYRLNTIKDIINYHELLEKNIKIYIKNNSN